MKTSQEALPTDVETLQTMVLELQQKKQYLLEQFRIKLELSRHSA